MSLIRKALSVGCLGWLAIPAAFAQTLPPSVVACAEEANDIARLACFDREIAQHKDVSKSVASTQVSPAQPAPDTPVVAPTQPQNAKSGADDFGVAGRLARRRAEQEKKTDEPAQELRAAVSKVRTKPYGELVFELDNGQVWEQPEKKYALTIKAGENVRITQGAMGSYFLVSDSGATTRVRRVR